MAIAKKRTSKKKVTKPKMVRTQFEEGEYEYGKGGRVSKGEMVWGKLTQSKKADFLYKNFTPEITPAGQETLSKRAYKFLPKNVKSKIESVYANAEEYAHGGGFNKDGEPYGFDDSEMNDREYYIREFLRDKKYPATNDEYKKISIETGYKLGDIIYTHQKMNNDLNYNVKYANGGGVGDINMEFLKVFRQYGFINSYSYGHNAYENKNKDIIVFSPKSDTIGKGWLTLQLSNNMEERLHLKPFTTSALIDLFNKYGLLPTVNKGELSYTLYSNGGGVGERFDFEVKGYATFINSNYEYRTINFIQEVTAKDESQAEYLAYKIVAGDLFDEYGVLDFDFEIMDIERIYAKGGGVSSKEAKAMKQLEKHIDYEFVNTDMGSGWAFSLDGFDLEMKYLDFFDSSDLGIEEDWDSLSKEDKDYYYEDWKESLWQSSYEQFKELAFKKYGYYYMEQGGNMNDCYCYEIGGL